MTQNGGMRLSAAMILALLFSATSWAQTQPRFAKLDVVVDQEMFARLCDLLNVTPERLPAAQEIFDAYSRQVQELQINAHKRVQDLGEREIDELGAIRDREIAGLHDLKDIDEIMRRRTAEMSELAYRALPVMHAAMESAFRDADVLLAQFCDQLRELLGLDESTSARVLRFLVRQNYLREIGRKAPADFEPTQDLFSTIDEATREGRELSWLRIPMGGSYRFLVHGTLGESQPDPSVRAAQDEFRRILNDYEITMDAALQSKRLENRTPLRPQDARAVSSNDPEYERQMKKLGLRWAQLHNPFWNSARQIEQLLDERSIPEMVAAWRDRVNRAMCPELTEPRWPVSANTWISEQSGLTVEQHEAIDAILQEWRLKQRELETQAIESGIEAKRERLIVNYHQEFPEDIQFAKRKLAVHRLNIDTYKKLLALLPSDAATKFAKAIAGSPGEHYTPSSFGPSIDWPLLTRLHAMDVYNGDWRFTNP